MNKTTNTKNNILAMPANAIAMPVKPNKAAIRETTKNTIAQKRFRFAGNIRDRLGRESAEGDVDEVSLVE